MFRKLAQQIKTKDLTSQKAFTVSPFEELKNETRKAFLRSLSTHALNLYEKKSDIKNFTKLALSDPEDLSHNKIMEDLNITDPLDYDELFDLADNEQFLKDLGL